MAPGVDIASLLRQKNLMDQLQQTTAQGTQSAMIQPGISQFQDNDNRTAAQQLGVRGTPGALYKAALTGGLGGATGPEAAMAKLPGIKQMTQAEQNIGKGITNRIQGAIQGPPPPVSKESALYGPVNPPTMVNKTGQAPVPTGHQLQIDPTTGQIITVPRQ